MKDAGLKLGGYLSAKDERETVGDELPVVFAVTKCHPTRAILYSAAFQGGWSVRFLNTLEEALSAAGSHKPLAVFYHHHSGDASWDGYCSSFSQAGIPFVLLAHKGDHETFMVVLGAGGYHACGNPLTSADIVKAVVFGGQMARHGNIPEMSA
jgi:hypothetical protein